MQRSMTSSESSEQTTCRFVFAYEPPNWNEYIGRERANFHAAAAIKRHEKGLAFGMPVYRGGYPAKITILAHFKDRRRDLDNVRYKGLLDSLVANGCIENDNLSHIQAIDIRPVFDGSTHVEIIVEPIDGR